MARRLLELQEHSPLKTFSSKSISSMQQLTLKYQNEDDKAYGLAGMAIALAALDALDRVAGVSLDSDGPMVTFSNEFYFSGSPSVSPKSTWNALLHNYYITSAMVVSSVMSRSLVPGQTRRG